MIIQQHTYIIEVADPDIAKKQHSELRNILEKFGSEVINVDELANHPNSVFTRDTALVTPRGYVKLSLGIETRKEEEQWMANILDSVDEPCAGVINEPGTVEGGDVIICGSVAFIGHTQRTNDEGIKQLSEILSEMDIEVRIAKIPNSYLHLDQVIGVLGPDFLIHCSGLFNEDFFDGFDTIECSCKGFNVNIICLGENEIIAPSTNTGLIASATEHGIKIHVLDLSEFAKGSGGPNCLVMPVERKQ